ncbi:MAG: gliding motility-associated C-terminal domain-containing protein [Saprospiraceae bacterium]|uniref:Gliding motility-associated C-terminal domain-containing protein n=1 Tax=Candidatus Opimibacter skivensis TaxID=2982028 RepID=A0A9D7XP73_9BACT|nr:gliding motility-associated C-terminal domain-containing protein [Candidatus Opimibacter skivensis]
MRTKFRVGIFYLVSLLYCSSTYGTPDIFPIQDIISCDMYVLPNIQGNGLTPTASYYTKPGGKGTHLAPGDTVFTSGVYYAFDEDGMGQDEECFFVQIINHLPDLSSLHDNSACAYYVLPFFVTPSVSGYAGYYSQNNAQGVRFQQGDTIFSSTSLYAYDGYQACSVEKQIKIIINAPPVFDSIYHQYGCHQYVFKAFGGQYIFSDSTYFLFGGQTYQIGDSTTNSGPVEVVTQNGTCIVKKTFELTIIDSINIDPIGDTLICGHRLYLPKISGTNITENAKYYPQNGGTGHAYFPEENYSIGISNTIYAFDYIPGTDCIDEEALHINSVEETNAYKDFHVLVCRGFKYNIYELLLGRNIEAQGNKIFPIDDQLILENEDTFDTSIYPEGEYQFYVVDSTGSPCINDTAIMTIVTTDKCQNEDQEAIYCKNPHNDKFLLTSNMTGNPDFCLGGYFLDENGSFISSWNQNYFLDRKTPKEYKFYYVLPDIHGQKDTSIITIKIIDDIQLQMTGSDTLCKGECTSVHVGFIDDDLYQTLVSIVTPIDQNLFNEAAYFDSLNRNNDIEVCYLNGDRVNNQENPDTIFLTLPDQVYKLELFAPQLKECQLDPEPIYFVTREPNTFYFEETLCPGENVEFNGQNFDETRPEGEILLNVPATNGCDSFIYVNLSFYNPATKLIKEEICDADTVIINCMAYTTSFNKDTQMLSGGGIYGCDSTIIIDLNFTKPEKIFIDTSLCEGQKLSIGDLFFDAEGTYTGIIKKKNLCDSLKYDITIHKSNSEKINIHWPDQLCLGDTAEITIDPAFQSTTWSTGEKGSKIKIVVPGDYKVTVLNSGGCAQDTSFQIVYNDSLHIAGDFEYQGTINEPIKFNLFSGGGPINVKWVPGSGLNCDTCLTPIATIPQTQEYRFTAQDGNGCTDEGIVRVEIKLDTKQDVYIPNVINPNSESLINRIFFIYTKGISVEYNLSIYDRWGGLLYNKENLTTNQSQGGWNGYFDNRAVQSGVYIYRIVLEGYDQPIIGTITVLN